MNDQTTITPAAADFVCPDGPGCPDPICQAERRKLGFLTITPDAAAVRPQRNTLNEARHTPGPWHRRTEGTGIGESIGPIVATPHGTGLLPIARIVLIGDTRDTANARLIAAAPELLAACKAAFSAHACDEGDLPLHVCEQLFAAINRAGGAA